MSNSTKKITIGITAHVDAGKTTLSEAILYLAGAIRQPGRVDHGSAFLDDDPIERERGITIFSQQARFALGDIEATLIDTPGHVDFSAEMERSLWVLDYALLVVSGSEGIQPHTKTIYRMLKERGIPCFVFVNKMDIAVKSKEDLISKFEAELDMPAVDFSGAEERTDEFIDAVTLHSVSLAEAVLEEMQDDDGGEDEIISDSQIARAVASGEIVPVMFGSALKMEGVEELLEVIGRYTEQAAYGSGFGAKVYRAQAAKDGEKLCFIKVTGGELRVRDTVSIRSAGEEDVREAKINQIRLYSGSKYETADSAQAGTICAVTGLGLVLPGSSLGEEEPSAELSSAPFMIYSVEAPEGMDVHDLMDDMRVLTAEDPALNASWSEDGSEVLIRIMGQVQLEVLQREILERFGYEVEFGRGRVLYMETISDTYEGVGHFEPLRHYAEVHLIIEPGERGSGVALTSEVSEDELDLNWQRLIMTHLEERAHAGVLTGSPLTDVKISIAAGRAHDKHTVGGDFREATYRAVRNALMQAKRDGNALLLEPWCEYEIELPAQHLGRAITDIKQMGGSQESLEQKEETAVIRGRVPSAEIEPYRQTLTGYTSGEGKLSVAQCGYDICHEAESVIEEIGYDAERDTVNPAGSVFVNHSGSDIVKWDEVPEHMHLGSVLEKRRMTAENEAAGNAGGPVSGWYAGSRSDARREAEIAAAREKDLRRIFEMTYGPQKAKTHIEKKERVFRNGPDFSEEEIAQNAARGEEIRAKHERKTVQKEEEQPLLIIDGYNLIHSDEEMKELAGRDIGSARDDLVDRLINYAGYTGLEVKLVFDAYKVVPGDGSTEDHESISVIYTAANEPADIRIGRMVEDAKGRQVYIVSSDELVQQDAWTKGALRISSREFMQILCDTEEEIRDRLRS